MLKEENRQDNPKNPNPKNVNYLPTTLHGVVKG